MHRFPLLLIFGLLAVLLGGCGGGSANADLWQPYVDAVRPTLVFFYTDN